MKNGAVDLPDLKNLSKLPDKKKQEVFQLLAAVDYEFYLEFVHRGIYRHGAHTRYICSQVQAVERGELDRLMVFLPPRHGKSMSISETFPSWFIGRNPTRKVIVTSYGDALAKRFGRANRRKVQEYGPGVFGIRLEPGSATVTNWEIDVHGGKMISAGIGGPISGEGADLLIIDDPIKNRQEAESLTYREMVWNEWQNTLLTRLHPGGSVIIILTRWHEDDLAGRLLQEEPDKWTVVNLPAEAEDEDLLGRPVGQPLWPEHGFDAEWATRTKREVGSRVWNALYQQRPSAQSGEILKRHWWKFWCMPGQEKQLQDVVVQLPNGNYDTVSPEPIDTRFERMGTSWDMSFSDTKTASYVVGQVWAMVGANKYLLDQVRDRMNFPTTISAVEALSRKWEHARPIWVENKANGPAVMDTLRGRIGGLVPVDPDGSKVARAYAVSPEIEAGNVYLPHPATAPWVSGFIEECAAFPNATNDDQVDAMTQALTKLTIGHRKIRTLPKQALGL